MPELGPSCTWLYRRLGGLLNRQPTEHRLDVVDLARSVGLGTGVGPNSPMSRSLLRLAHFEVVQPDSQGLAVRLALAPLSERQLMRLPDCVRRAHDLLVGS